MIARCLALLAGLTMVLHAQEKRTITARTLCFSYVDGVKNVFVPAGKEGGMVEIPLFTSVISESFEMIAIDGAGVFSLPSDNAEQPYKPFPAARLPGSTSQVLFLFLPTSDKAKAPYRVVALADDKKNFPYGSVRLMNLSPYPVQFHMGEFNGKKAIGLNPGKSQSVAKVSRVDGFNRYPVRADYRTEKGFVPFYNNAWRSVKDKRDLVIAYRDPATGDPHLNHYEDAEPADLGPVIDTPGQ